LCIYSVEEELKKNLNAQKVENVKV